MKWGWGVRVFESEGRLVPHCGSLLGLKPRALQGVVIC